MNLKEEIKEFMNSKVSKKALRIHTAEAYSEYLADQIVEIVHKRIKNRESLL